MTLITRSGFPILIPLMAAKMSADMFPKAKKVTPAMFCDKPNVLLIMNKAGHRLLTQDEF